MKLNICNWIGIFMILTLSIIGSAEAQTYEVYDQNLKLKSRIEFDEIIVLGESVRVSTANNELKLLSKEYKPFVDLKGIRVFQYDQPWIIVEGPTGKGAFHEYGEEVMPLEYDDIDVLFTKLLGRKGNDYWLYSHATRKTTNIGTFDEAKLAQNGQVIGKKDGKYFLPLSSIPQKPFEEINEVNESFLISKEPSGYGLINRDAEYILKPVIDHMSYLEGDYFYAFDGNQYMLVRCLEDRADIKYSSYHKITLEDGMLLEYIHGKLRRVMKNDGILLDQIGMEKVVSVGEKHYNVLLRDGKTGLLGPEGWEVSPIDSVQIILPGNEGLYPANHKGKFGFIDNEGIWAVQPEFEEVRNFSDGIAVFKNNGQWGMINKNGEEVASANFDQISDFYRGKAIAKVYGRNMLIDKQGLAILDKKYDRISLAADNYFITEDEGKFGLISPDGKEIIEPKFQELRREDLNKILVKIGDKYGILDENGEYLLPVYYKNIVFDSGAKQILAEDEYQFLPEEKIEVPTGKKKKGG